LFLLNGNCKHSNTPWKLFKTEVVFFFNQIEKNIFYPNKKNSVDKKAPHYNLPQNNRKESLMKRKCLFWIFLLLLLLIRTGQTHIWDRFPNQGTNFGVPFGPSFFFYSKFFFYSQIFSFKWLLWLTGQGPPRSRCVLVSRRWLSFFWKKKKLFFIWNNIMFFLLKISTFTSLIEIECEQH
jgi:hypothetical protein